MSDFAVLKLPVPSLRTARQMVTGCGSVAALRGLNANRVVILLSNALANDKQRLEVLVDNVRAKRVSVLVKDWIGEPDLKSISGVLRKIEDAQPDAIIAIGGGAVLDGAKILWLLYEHPTLTLKVLSRPFDLPPLRGRARLVLVPSTVGSGSEVSSAAMLVDRDANKKVPVVTHDFLPDLAILDPNFLEGLPKKVIASTSCDALAHAVEGFVSTVSNPMMDVFAEKAVGEISRHVKAGLEGDLSALERLQYAAMLAGWVQNHCLVGAAHSIAHQLSDMSHSEAVAMMLPAVVRTNARTRAERYAALARASGVGKSFESLAELSEEITSMGGLSLSFPELGERRKQELIANAITDAGGRANPIPVDGSLVEELISGVSR